MRRLGLAAVVLVALLAGAPTAALAARPATLSGRLVGARLPPAGRGAIPVAAMSLRNGQLVAGAYASPAGRFTLKTPPGSYAVLATVVRARGAKPLERVADFVTARAGRRVALRPTLRRRKRVGRRRPRHRRGRARASASFGFVDVPFTAIWVRQWDTPDGDLAIFRRGMTDMVITDLVATIDRCDAVVVERARLSDVIGELALQQSPRFDPSTRLRTDTLWAHNATVDGSLTVSGGDVTLTATYHDLRSGRRATVGASGPGEDVFDLEQQLAQKLSDVICQETPQRYVGTFSGSATSALNQYRVTWNGTATLTLDREHGFAPFGWPAGDYVHYALSDGSAHVVLDGTRGVCAAHGETDVRLVVGAVGGGEASVQRDAPNGQPAYSLSIAAPATASIPYRETGFGCQSNPEYPLTGFLFAYTPTPVTTTDSGALAASTSWRRDMFSDFGFSFSLAPQG